MDESTRIDDLLDRLIGRRIGYAPGQWPRRVHEVVEQLAKTVHEKPSAMLASLLGADDPLVIGALIDAAAVGHTSFFRHPEQFDHLRAMLPVFSRKRGRKLKIWCAACSTGEEAYSIALCAEERGVAVQIFATDVNPAAIHRARVGRYTKGRMGRLPGDASSKEWSAPASLRRSIRFEMASLSDPEPALGEGPFDLIFCRNVLIYFDRAAVPHVLRGISERLAYRGVIVVSPADAILPLPESLKRGKMVGWLHLADQPPISMQTPASVRGRGSVGPPPRLNSEPPSSSEAALEAAARLLGSGQVAEAERILTACLDEHDDDIAAWFLLGEALVQRGEPAQAYAAFLRASRSDPSSSKEIDGEALRRSANLRAMALMRRSGERR